MKPPLLESAPFLKPVGLTAPEADYVTDLEERRDNRLISIFMGSLVSVALLIIGLH